MMFRKRTLLAVASILALGVLVPVAADAAMGARLDPSQHLTTTGVRVTGTVSNWDSDAVSAVFHARITQGTHSASGSSRRYFAGAAAFSLLATGSGLKPGAAVGHASMTVTLKNGQLETYKWTVPVTLVS